MSVEGKPSGIRDETEALKVYPFSITTRVAIFLLCCVVIPMFFTGLCIEKGYLLPGKNAYLAIPVFLIPLTVPFAKFVAFYLIERDLKEIARFCLEVKKGNYLLYFDILNQRNKRDSLIVLLQNLTWMNRSLSHRELGNQNRFQQLRKDFGKVEKQAYTDPLTGLFNRRYLKKTISDYVQGLPLQKIVCMIYIDLDKFKNVNDTLGHAAGDELLVWLANCIKETCRCETDIPLRMGGDEFALLLMDVSAKEAVAIGRRIRDYYHRKNVFGTTLSIGVASLPEAEKICWSSIDLLTECADRQAYLVKKEGGDSVGIDGRTINLPPESEVRNERAHTLATIDPLTGLPNRYLAKERFQQALKRATRRKNKLCMMFLDIDDFKSVNEAFGHEAGDRFLRHIVLALKSVLRAEDSICRLGGDEFLIIAENMQGRQDVPALVLKITNAVKRSAVINKQHISATSSIGITLIPDDGEDFDDLCRRVDVALSDAKRSGKNNFSFFNPEMAEAVTESLSLITDLHSALALKQMELYFQPQIALETGHVVGAESLIRWHHPEKGFLSPVYFIQLAERSGQIIELGNWIIENACKKCAEWNLYSVEDLVIAINISQIQVRRGGIAEKVLECIDKYGLKGSNIELEFTESFLFENSSKIKKEFDILRKADVRLAIDDFGTGYSNLSYIKNFNISKIKIDRSFVGNIIDNRCDQVIVEAIINMARNLEIQIVAEGIEDVKTMELLKSMHCDIGQGFYWDKPMSESAFLDFLAANSQATTHFTNCD